MAALFRCFRKKGKSENNSLPEGPAKNHRCNEVCNKCEKVSILVRCSHCKATLVGYWEKDGNIPVCKSNGAKNDGGICTKLVNVCSDNKTGQVDTDSSSGGHSPTNPVPPPMAPRSPNENSNGDGYFDYRPSAHSNVPGLSYNFVSKDDPNYNMNNPRRGKALIFNFDKYESTSNSYLDTTPSPRLGSEKDKKDLMACLERMSFEVVPHDNLRRQEFDGVIEAVRREDHSDADCIIVAIMTHGEKNSIYLSDGSLIPVNSVWQEFEANKCPTLAGKPKIFLIQACRGEDYDHGTRMRRGSGMEAPRNDITDSGTFSYVIPNAADIIVAFSCPLGQYSWRSPQRGSWFIQSICHVFNQHAYDMELQSLLTTVAREVAVNYESNTDNIDTNQKKQVPSTSSTLIRNVFFSPKPLVKYRPPPSQSGICCTIESATQTAEERRISLGLSNISLQHVQVAVAQAQQIAQQTSEFNANGGIINGVIPLSPLSNYTGRETAVDTALVGSPPDEEKGEPSVTESVMDENDLLYDAEQQQVHSLNHI